MAEEPHDLVLDHLRVIREQLTGVREVLREHGSRLTRIELGIAGLRRDQAQDAEQVAHLEARLDALHDRLARVELRLDLKES